MSTKVKTTTNAGANEPLQLGPVQYKLLPREVYGVNDRQHPFYDGKLDNSIDTLHVLRGTTGHFVLKLTPAEKEYIMNGLGLSEQDLNTGNMKNEYLRGLSVELPKYGVALDTTDPYDLLRDKLLQAYDNYIAPNIASITHKKSYRFVRISEGEKTREILKKSDLRKVAYKLLGTLEESRERMVMYLLNDGARVHPQINKDELRRLVNDTVERNYQTFITRMEDPMFNEKGLLNMAVVSGVVDLNSKMYYYEGAPLAFKGDLATIENAAKYVADKANADTKLAISKLTLNKFNNQ